MTNLHASNDNLKITAGRKLIIMKAIWRVPARELSPPASKILQYLVEMTHQEKRYAWPSYATIASECALALSTAKKCVKQLEIAGWITVTRSGKTGEGHDDSNRYYVHLWDEDSLTAKCRAYPRKSNMVGRDTDQGGPQNGPGVDRVTVDGGPQCSPNTSEYTPDVDTPESHTIPERFASGRNQMAFGNDDRDRSAPAKYHQSKLDADQAMARLRAMNWRTAGDSADPRHDPSDRAEHRGVPAQWYLLLKEGRSANDVVTAAERFLRNTYSNQRPSLAGFLGRYARAWMDESDHDLSINVMEPPVAANDDLPSPDKKVSGYDDDVPF
jgi:hypothetical protein